MTTIETATVADPELQLTADELQLLLDTTTPTAAESGLASPHTSGDDASSLSDRSVSVQDVSADSVQAKRARRTEIEKFSRRRRQATLREMREQVKALETQMATLLAAHRTDETPALANTDTATSPQDSGDSMESLRAKFIQLSVGAQRLEAEKMDLRKMLRARQLLATTVRSLADAFVDDWDEYTWFHILERPYVPLPREEHFRVMRESYEAINAYDARADCVSSGKAFFGWVDRRHVDESGMFFSFSKSFDGHDPERIMLDSWDVFSTEDKLRQALIRSNGYLRLRTLQEPNDDMMVLHRQTKITKMNKTFHTVFLLYRLRTDDGYTICFRTIPAPGIQESLTELDMWIDTFHWIHFKHIRDKTTGASTGCQVVFGGAIGGRLFTTIAEFLLGSFATVVRWEDACIAPMFIMA